MAAGFLNRRSIGQGIEQPPLGRGINHPPHRHTIRDIGDVHGEIATALHEFLGAIQRIDNDEIAGDMTMRRRLFLGHHDHPGKGGGQTGRNDRVGGLIRLGHRAGIRFRPHREIGGGINLHDPVARFQRQLSENSHNPVKIHRQLPLSRRR